jgi:hypothetical protein
MLVETGRAPVVLTPNQPAVRRTLRAQIARLETQLAALVGDAPPVAHRSREGPRLLGVEALERVRDALVARLTEARARAAERSEREAEARRRLEAMLAAPERHRFERVGLAELGQPACGAYAVRPRLGLVGMLAGWWEVKLSSGCPLPAPDAHRRLGGAVAAGAHPRADPAGAVEADAQRRSAAAVRQRPRPADPDLGTADRRTAALDPESETRDLADDGRARADAQT